MASRTPRRTAGHGVLLAPAVIADMSAHLPDVADRTVEAIIDEVPSYEGALSGSMGEIIRNAVQLALGGFLSLAGGKRGADPGTPTAPAMEGAYQLGRGEARNGRSTDALLSAYRIGARVSWREMSARAVAAGIPADRLAGFAELVFAYIDELSAASVAVEQAAARADWTAPSTLTAVIVPEAQARHVRASLSGTVLQAVDRTDM